MTYGPAESFNRHFETALAAQVAKSGMPVRDWFNTGRRSPDKDVQWWRDNGPGLVQKFIDWYESHPDINVWTTPDGKPAIELDLTVMFGKVPVRCIIDQVLQAGTALIVNDLKSGSKTPESLEQLGIYSCAIELAYGIRPKYGTFFMHKLDKPFQTPVVLDGYQFGLDYWTAQFEQFDRAERSGIYVAKPAKQCDRCGVAGKCPAMGVRPKSS